MAITLYMTEASPPCRTVTMTAKMIGVELEKKIVNLLAGEHLKPDFIAINPQHNIPLMDDGGFYLNESRAICGYLVQQYAKDDKLYPKDPKQRAVVDQRLYFDMETFYNKFAKAYFLLAMGKTTEVDEKSLKELEEAIGFLELFLGTTKYVAGDHLTIADLAMVSSATSMQAVNKNIFDNYPKIQSWLETCKAEIVDYQTVNQVGADRLGEWVKAGLAKLK